MKVTIVGAGAIGALMGASMIKAGIDVTFVEKDRERVDAMNGRGLTIHTAAGDWNVPAKAVEPSQYARITISRFLPTNASAGRIRRPTILPGLSTSNIVTAFPGFKVTFDSIRSTCPPGGTT